MKYLVRPLICICILFAFFSCKVDIRDSIPEDILSDLPSSQELGEYIYDNLPRYDTVLEEATWNVSGENFIYELPPSVGTLHVNAPKNSQVFLVKTNPSLSTIRSWSTRYIRSLGTSISTRTASDSKVDFFDPRELLKSSDEFFPIDYAPARNFVRPKLPLPPTRSATVVEDKSDLTREYREGERQLFYTDDSKTQEWATLRLKGQYCNIWVVDKYYTTEGVYGQGTTVNFGSINFLKAKFDSSYPIVQAIFGKEQNFITDRNNKKVPINEKVNIIVYDIGKDGASGGTVGFFWGKDFYTSDIYRDSNEGKFFYVDSYWVRSSIGLSASTLVHEFQHMVHFSTKPSSATWYNEMLSMLCEDALHTHLELTEERSPRSRLSMFCEGYWLSGLTNWLGGNDVLYSYAGAYAFGAFLIRNYGGISLLKEIATNSSVNQESITEALKKLGKDKTFDQVFQEYVTAVLMWDSDDVTRPSFNKGVVENIAGYQFYLPAINLGNYNVRVVEGMQVGGPVLLPAGIEGQEHLQPYGFSLHKVGAIGSNNPLTIKFSIPYSSGGKNFLFVK